MLSKYFKKDQGSEIGSGIGAGMSKKDRPKSVGRATSKKLVRRDGRYAASKASSIVGMILGAPGKKIMKSN